MSFTVIGLPELLLGFGAAKGEIEVAERAGVSEGAAIIRSQWVDNIESEGLVLTGRYRDSIMVELDGAEAIVLTEVPYADILEYGDSRQAGHHVAYRAFEEHHEDVTDHVAERVREVLV